MYGSDEIEVKFSNSLKISDAERRFSPSIEYKGADHFLSLFTNNAIFTNEANDYRGAAIKEWIDFARAKSKPTSKAIDLTHRDHKIVINAQVSGNFSRSLHYDFTLKSNKITALAIERNDLQYHYG